MSPIWRDKPRSRLKKVLGMKLVLHDSCKWDWCNACRNSEWANAIWCSECEKRGK